MDAGLDLSKTIDLAMVFTKRGNMALDMASIDIATDDRIFLKEAAQFFSNPGLVAKSLAWAGKPIETLHGRLPAMVQNAISVGTEKAIKKAMVAAVKTLPSQQDISHREDQSLQSSRLHRGLTTLTGAAGGIFGLPALAIELPITTVLILRAILDQARLFGHDLDNLETRLECLMVFTMGVSSTDGGLEKIQSHSVGQYFLTRASFVGAMREAVSVLGAFTAKELASSIERGAAPLFAKLAAGVAQKFQVRVSQKFVAESLPLVGAVGGGALNYAFTDFFVKAARFHFGIRALEKKYGEQNVQDYLKSVETRGA